ncbi:hypothetical protein D3C71_1572910 [compost metagenome]
MKSLLGLGVRQRNILQLPVSPAQACNDRQSDLPVHHIQNLLQKGHGPQMILLLIPLREAEHNHSPAAAQIDSRSGILRIDDFLGHVAQRIGVKRLIPGRYAPFLADLRRTHHIPFRKKMNPRKFQMRGNNRIVCPVTYQNIHDGPPFQHGLGIPELLLQLLPVHKHLVEEALQVRDTPWSGGGSTSPCRSAIAGQLAQHPVYGAKGAPVHHKENHECH